MSDEIARNDRIRLLHMVEAAEQALDFASGRTRESLETDAMFRRAVVNCIQEIGEAAVSVSASTRQRLPDVPSTSIVGMRNRLVHGYFDIRIDAVWEVLTTDLGPLINRVRDTLGPHPLD